MVSKNIFLVYFKLLVTKLGLEKLSYLKYLNLSCNEIVNSLQQLGAFVENCSKLQVLDLTNNPCASGDKFKVSLLANIPRLAAVDCNFRVLSSIITVNERVEAWRIMGGSLEESEKKRADLALFLRSDPGKLPHEVKCLDLSGLDLHALNLERFTNLTKLSLRNNKLRSLNGIGLTSLLSLRVLDLRDNLLFNFEEIEQVTSVLSRLRYIGLDGNDGMRFLYFFFAFKRFNCY